MPTAADNRLASARLPASGLGAEPGHAPPQLHGSLQPAALLSDVQGGAPISVCMEHVGLVLRQHCDAVQAAVACCMAQSGAPFVVLGVHERLPVPAAGEQGLGSPSSICGPTLISRLCCSHTGSLDG